jgi:hypothetical protein
LDHALLCQAVTQTRLSIRILGFSEDRDVTVSALLTMNGNNLVLQGDMPRRSVRCEMDAKVERPELRVFTGPNIQTEFRRRRVRGGTVDHSAGVSGFRGDFDQAGTG